jgi:hypothetical protein
VTLLCAVVEVALHPPARGVGRVHDPGTRLDRVGEARERLRAQLLVPEREVRRRPELALERLGGGRLGLDDSDLAGAGAGDDRRDPPPLVEVERAPVGVDDAAAGPDRVAEAEPRVADGAREEGAQPALGLGPLEIDRQPPHERPDEPRPDRNPHERAADGDKSERAGGEQPRVERAVGTFPRLEMARGCVRRVCRAGDRSRSERRGRRPLSSPASTAEPRRAGERRDDAAREGQAEHDRQEPSR